MNKSIQIQLILQPDCKLVAIDEENYDSLDIDLTKHYMLEFLVYNEEQTPISNTIHLYKETSIIEYITNVRQTEFILTKDGTYRYYKLIIPTLDRFKSEENNLLYINLSGQLYFENNQLYLSTLSDNLTHTYEEVRNNRELVSDYLKAYELIHKNESSQSFYSPVKYVFSVCKLQKCLVSLQKKLLFLNCGLEQCGENKILINRRDFLLSALYVFDYLTDIQDFTEAQRLLDNLSTCNSICEDELDNIYNNCNCGNVVS